MLNNPFMFIIDKGCTEVEMLNKPRVLNASDTKRQPMLAWHHPSFRSRNLWALHFPPCLTNPPFIDIPIPIVFLCHITMSSYHHDNKPFRFRASLLSFIVVYVLHFVSHSLATSPSFISLCACAHCQMFSQ